MPLRELDGDALVRHKEAFKLLASMEREDVIALHLLLKESNGPDRAFHTLQNAIITNRFPFDMREFSIIDDTGEPIPDSDETALFGRISSGLIALVRNESLRFALDAIIVRYGYQPSPDDRHPVFANMRSLLIIVTELVNSLPLYSIYKLAGELKG